MIGNAIGGRIIELDDTDSTNSYAARLLHNEFPEEGTVIMAHVQKAGRGQRSSTWNSQAGKNLLLSYILYPVFLPPADQFLLNQAVALAVYDFIVQSGTGEAGIKWPNDILLNRRKIAGVLIENTIRSNSIINSIAGIGVNINQVDFPVFNLPVTSLALTENKMFALHDCLYLLNSTLDKWYTALQLGQFEKIRKAYSAALYLAGIEALFESNGERFYGTISGVTAEGKLVVEKNNGPSLQFMNKEISFIF
jgi:BirA family transcriptional regulator, biotin operon repressor / biotin---[acetyl-CoA-carboxylase] ligase